MATPINFTIYNADGSRNTTATPTFASADHYTTRAGVNRTAPAITNRGGGKFSFLPSDADESIGVAYIVTTGAYPAMYAGAVTTPDEDFGVFLFTDTAGALISSGSPAVTVYKDFDGNNLTAPSCVQAKAYLWTLTPLTADIEEGVSYIVSAPASTLPAFYDGDMFNGDLGLPLPSTVAPVVGNFSPATNSTLQPTDSITFDVTVADGTALANVQVSAVFGTFQLEEGIFDGYAFSDLYSTSSRTNITNGYRFHVVRRAVWPSSPRLKVRAITVTGKLNA